MGFAKKLEKKILNEWKQWYLDYNLLTQSIDNEHEFIQKFLHELAKVEEFYMYAEKEILRGKDMMKKLFNIKDEEEIVFRGTVNSEPKVLPTSSLDAGSCFGDTHSSTSSHSELSSSTEEENIFKEKPITDEKIKKTKEKFNKTEKTLKDIKEQIEKTKKIKEEKIKKEILKEKCFESEVDEEREPDNEEETETKPVKLGWKDKIFAQKDKLFANNIFKRNYDKAKSEKAILDYIVSLKHVLKYRNLNILGFKKILTKFDSLKDRNLTHVLFPTVERAHFFRSREIDSIIKLMTNKYTSIYHKNNPKKAKEILENINKKQKVNQLNIFLCGVFLTVSFFIHLNNFDKAKSGIKLDYYFSVMGILLGGLFFGACSVIFKYYSINSPFIFEFTVGSKFQNDKYLLYVSTLILIHQLSTKFIFDKTNSLLCIVLVIIQFLPFHVYYLRSRYYILGTLIKVFSAPLFSVRFKHFFLADVICSFSLSIKLFIFSCELPKSSKLMVLLLYPSLIRVFQCLRRYIDEGFKLQLYNALKYVCSIFSTSYGVLVGMYGKEYKYLEYSLLSVSSTYSLFWDLFFDWNIFRNEYIFPKIYYVLIVIFNLFARYIWLIKIYYKIDDYYSLVIEVVRRFLWLLIRVEIEHLYNCNKLTAMKYVNIKREELFFVKDYKPLSQYLDSEHTISNSEV